MPIDEKPCYMTMETVAGILCCSQKHVYNLIFEGKLEAIKIGSRAVRISERSLHEFITMNRINPDDLFDPDVEKKDVAVPTPVVKSRWMQK